MLRRATDLPRWRRAFLDEELTRLAAPGFGAELVVDSAADDAGECGADPAGRAAAAVPALGRAERPAGRSRSVGRGVRRGVGFRRAVRLHAAPVRPGRVGALGRPDVSAVAGRVDGVRRSRPARGAASGRSVCAAGGLQLQQRAVRRARARVRRGHAAAERPVRPGRGRGAVRPDRVRRRSCCRSASTS